MTTCNIAGALNSLLSWREAHPEAEVPMVVTHSSGNHGQAVAWAARQTGSPCTVVVPEGTPRVAGLQINLICRGLVYFNPLFGKT